MKADKKKEVRTLSLRIPEKVAKLAEKRAKAQNRSLNAQIVHEVELNGLPQGQTGQTVASNTITITRPEFETFTEGYK